MAPGATSVKYITPSWSEIQTTMTATTDPIQDLIVMDVFQGQTPFIQPTQGLRQFGHW